MKTTTRMWSAAAGLCIALTLAGPGLAQGSGPAEIPPSGYDANSYVDSRGCVFLRVGVGNATQWAPRVGADRQPVCGQEPTFSPTEPTEAAAPTIRTASASPTRPRAVPANATRPARQARPARASSSDPVLVIVPRSVVLDGAVEVACPAVTGAAADYLARPDVTCMRVSRASLNAHATGAVTSLDLDLPSPPPGYRRGWEDGRINPYAGVRTVEGEIRMRQIWTDTVPRRLIGTE